MNGRVYLVGAGPGDPDLLTLRAASLLARADVVFHDAMVSPEVVAMAPQAEVVCVGKRAGRPSWQQEEINRRLVGSARAGRIVVRLKNGDPFVFGRGGEEMLALAEAGIPVEVVPGITSAVSAAACAGIPVTHRGLSSALLVVAGHEPEAYEPSLRSLSPGSATVVILMGLRTMPATSALLLECGWPSDTPVAVIRAAWTPRCRQWRGTLAQLATGAAAQPEGEPDPGVVVVGDVAALTGPASDGP